MYGVQTQKMKVIGNGFASPRSKNFIKEATRQKQAQKNKKDKYIFYIGRLEERKNIIGIIKAFEILKQKYQYSEKLILAGNPGHGYEKIKQVLKNSQCKNDIKQLGFLHDDKKWFLIKNANLFMFPSHSEGFGIPILEAQSMGTPVVTSNRSPMKETVGDERVLADPDNPKDIAKVANKILQDETLRNSITEQGLKNINRFSWQKTAQTIGLLLNDK